MEIALVFVILVARSSFSPPSGSAWTWSACWSCWSSASPDWSPRKRPSPAFRNPAVITVAAMFVISAAITNTGAMGAVGERLIRLAEGERGPAGGGDHAHRRLLLLLHQQHRLHGGDAAGGGRHRPHPQAQSLPASHPPRLRFPARRRLHPDRHSPQHPHERPAAAVCRRISGDVRLHPGGTGCGRRRGRSTCPWSAATCCRERKAGLLTEAYQVKEYIAEVEILADSPLAGTEHRPQQPGAGFQPAGARHPARPAQASVAAPQHQAARRGHPVSGGESGRHPQAAADPGPGGGAGTGQPAPRPSRQRDGGGRGLADPDLGPGREDPARGPLPRHPRADGAGDLAPRRPGGEEGRPCRPRVRRRAAAAGGRGERRPARQGGRFPAPWRRVADPLPADQGPAGRGHPRRGHSAGGDRTPADHAHRHPRRPGPGSEPLPLPARRPTTASTGGSSC